MQKQVNAIIQQFPNESVVDRQNGSPDHGQEIKQKTFAA